MLANYKKPKGWARVQGRFWVALGTVFLIFPLFLINLIQMLSFVLIRPFSLLAFRRFNRFLANAYWGSLVLWSERVLGTQVELYGDPLPPRETVVVFCNHQQISDVVALMSLAHRCGRVGDIKWFVKDIVKYIPGPGWGMQFLDCVFLKRNWVKDRQTVLRTFSRLRSSGMPFWLASFVEGTRIRQHKLKASQEFARSRGLPVLEHLLYPRTKGFVASVHALRDRVEAVYDVTIGFSEGIPTLWDFYSKGMGGYQMHVRRFSIDELPTDEQALSDWLVQRFVEKDQLLKTFEQTGRFPGPVAVETRRSSDRVFSSAHGQS